MSEEPQQYHAPNQDNAITTEPETASMKEARTSLSTFNDDASGYQRDSNECTEFCMDLFICFGACDACCPLSGEGCLSSLAAFVGNLCFACCKC